MSNGLALSGHTHSASVSFSSSLPSQAPSAFRRQKERADVLSGCYGNIMLKRKRMEVSGPTVAYWPLTHVSKKCLDIEVLRINIYIS